MAGSLYFDLDPEEMEVFCMEAEDLVQQLDTDLLFLEAASDDPTETHTSAEIVQHIFRAVHTLKGSAATIGHQPMTDLAHSMETVLDLLRQEHLAASSEMLDLLLEAVDMLRVFSREVSTQQHSGADPDALIFNLQALAALAEAATPATDVQPAALTLGRPSSADSTQPTLMQISVEIAQDSILPAARALQVVMALEECGQTLSCTPAREAIERGDPLLRADVLLATTWQPDALRQQLQHIGELTDVQIAILQQQVRSDGLEPATPDSIRSRGAALPRQTGASLKTDIKTVRTSVERLDKLMNLVGELVTDRNRLLQTHALLRAQYQEAEGLGDLAQAISHMAGITDELQEEVMRARMLPLEQVFNKFPRMVRDLARDIGKEITLEIQGQETELDRSVIEEISDPLMHLLRNAVDHGIEFPEKRLAAGKPKAGTIRLAGRSEGNHIVITVSDDGAGIDVDRVRASAIQRGLITEESAARLNDAEVVDLIFLAGLSTARSISDVSGRGVGMDVVRANIERLRGTVNVETHPGQGTTFELRLPLTLAIMPVLLVDLDGGTYCIPLSSITEVLRITPRSIHRVDRGEVMLWRDTTMPLLRLRRIFRLDGQGPDPDEQSFPVVAARWGEEKAGLVVDRLLGQQEIVIKNLGRMIGQATGISGATILGDGSVALIIDVPGLIKQVARELR